MGAVLLTETVKDCIPAKPEQFLRNFYNHLQEESRIEYGTDPYSGQWGAAGEGLNVLTMNPLKDYQAAQDYAEEHCDKWGPALAIPYLGTRKTYDAASKKIFDRISTASKEVEARCVKIHKEVQSTKSKTKGCTKCGSSVARKYIDQYCNCPVCGKKHSLMSASQDKYLNNAITKLKDLKKLKRSKVPGAGTCYVIAAVAPE